jgi:hypothetical protein
MKNTMAPHPGGLEPTELQVPPANHHSHDNPITGGNRMHPMGTSLPTSEMNSAPLPK